MENHLSTSAIQAAFWSKFIFVVLDTETNGLDPIEHEPCEVAMLKMVSGVVQEPFSWYVKPKLPIPPHVQAVHHISNQDVKDARTMNEMAGTFQEFCRGENVVIVAHNAPFDFGMMPALQSDEFKWVDNLRLARHIWPLGTPSPSTGHPLTAHKNKILQHWLNLDVDTRGQAAHRAQADILVTAELFRAGVNAYLNTLDHIPSYDEFASYLASPCRVETLNFGPFKDVPIEDVPTAHLRSLLARHRQDKMDLGVDLEWSIQDEYQKRTSHPLLNEAKANHVSDATVLFSESEKEKELLRLQIKKQAKQTGASFNTTNS